MRVWHFWSKNSSGPAKRVTGWETLLMDYWPHSALLPYLFLDFYSPCHSIFFFYFLPLSFNHTLALFSQHELCSSVALCYRKASVCKHNKELLQFSIKLNKHLKMRRNQLVQCYTFDRGVKFSLGEVHRQTVYKSVICTASLTMLTLLIK